MAVMFVCNHWQTEIQLWSRKKVSYQKNSGKIIYIIKAKKMFVRTNTYDSRCLEK